MTVIIVGGTDTAPTRPPGLETAANVEIWTPAGAAEPGSVTGLAQALTGFEADTSGQQVESIVLADDSDAALAAALVGTKLLIPVLATDAARDGSTVNGRLIAQLAGAYTGPA